MKKFLKKWFGVFIEFRASALMTRRDEFLIHINPADNEHGATKIGFKMNQLIMIITSVLLLYLLSWNPLLISGTCQSNKKVCNNSLLHKQGFWQWCTLVYLWFAWRSDHRETIELFRFYPCKFQARWFREVPREIVSQGKSMSFQIDCLAQRYSVEMRHGLRNYRMIILIRYFRGSF